MSEALPPREQLAMFDLGPAKPEEPKPALVIDRAPAGRHTSAARQLRALQRSIPIGVAKVEPMPMIVGGVCSELRERTRPDGTVGPCARVRCPHHLALDQGEIVQIGPTREAGLVCSTAGKPVEMGRRAALSPYPDTHAEIVAFEDLVIERLGELPDTCTLDVIARHPDGAPVEVIAATLGVTEEIVRRAYKSVVDKGFDPTCESAADNLDEMAPRTKRARHKSASKATPPSPVTAVRIVLNQERDRKVPAPREKTADEIFGDDW